MDVKNSLQPQIDWLTEAAGRELAGCQITAHDGTTLYTPDGEGNYCALWTRDFAYMVANAWDLLPVDDVKKCIIYLLEGQRDDGCVPDRVQADGLAVYAAGPVERPLGAPPTDNSQFLVNLIYTYVSKIGDDIFAKNALPQLIKAMDFTPISERGLVMIAPDIPQSPYGFTDTTAKTGELLFSSLLYWQACKEIAYLCEICGTDSTDYLTRADRIVTNMDILWASDRGTFLAATNQCAQVDIWGNAYAVFSGFLDDPRTPKGRKAEVLEFLMRHYIDYVSRGQVSHLLKGEFWEYTLMPVVPGTYQNGAYWATASGWVMAALDQVQKSMAVKLLQDLVNDFQAVGIYECVNGDYKKLNHYVVSAVNPLGVCKLLYT